MMKTIKGILIFIGVILLIAFLAPLLIVIVPSVLLVVMVREEISLCVFRRREDGNVYLICTSHRNWHDFFKNNVMPILPDNYRVIWHKTRRASRPRILDHLTRSKVFSVAKPYMVVVTSKALLHQSLNLALQHLKNQAKRSEVTQAACAEIIRNMEQELRTGKCRLPRVPLGT